MSLHLWMSDGLMAIFFLLVGLEIKSEFVDGRLSTWERRGLAVIAAAAGMLVPACIFLFVGRGNPALEKGWAILAVTTIAFDMGVMALLDRRVPTSLNLYIPTAAMAVTMGRSTGWLVGMVC